MELILSGNRDDHDPHQHHCYSCSAPVSSSSSSSSCSPTPTPTPSPLSSPPLPISFGPDYHKYHLSSSSSATSPPPPSPRQPSISCIQLNALPPRHLFNHQQNPSLDIDTAAPLLILKSSSAMSFSLEHITYHEAHSNDPISNTTGSHNTDTITTTSASSSCLKHL